MVRPTQPPLVGQLRDQHDVIEPVVGSFFHWVREGQGSDPAVRQTYVEFFREWVEGFHHELEEQLFDALADHAEIPMERGPVMVLRREHEAIRSLVSALESSQPGDATARLGVKLAGVLWMHIDKENSVMLPEAGERLVRSGGGDLMGRPATLAEERLRERVSVCVERWAPRDDDDLYRGDGCMACDAYGAECGGIEKEWWNSWEWDYHNSYQG